MHSINKTILERNTDSFEPGGSEKLKTLFRFYFDNWNSESEEIFALGFKLCQIMVKSENNKGNTIAICVLNFSLIVQLLS